MLHTMNTLSMTCMLEPILWFLALFSYSQRGRQGYIPWFRFYLATQLAISAISVPILFLMFWSSGGISHILSHAYVQLSWWGAVFAGVFAIATLRSILKRLLASLIGIQRAALIVFQWLVVAAFFVILARMLAQTGNATLDQELAMVSYGIYVCELILLALMLPFTFILRRSLRSHFQDLIMGLAVLAVSDSGIGLFFRGNAVLSSGAPTVAANVILIATLVFWISCFVAQGKPVSPRMFSIDSKLVRWSERLRLLDRGWTERGR